MAEDLSPSELDEKYFPEEDIWPSEATWVLFAEEPGMDDLYERAGDSLDKNLEKLQIFPINVDNKRRLYLGRFEMVKGGESLQFSEASLGRGKVVGFMDFLAGFPMECTEMLAMVGEISSRQDLEEGNFDVLPGKDLVTPPMPKSLFAGYREEKILLNLLYLDTDYAKTMVEGLKGEPEPKSLKWWVRVNFVESVGAKFPYPGEFVALAVRLMPDKFWDQQESSPFLFSGNWVDTVYLTSGIIKEIQPPDDNRAYPTYTVQWRKEEIKEVRASDFAEYKVGDRVVILKDVETEKKSQLWKDEDMQEGKFDREKWVIAPLAFYGIDPEKEE